MFQFIPPFLEWENLLSQLFAAPAYLNCKLFRPRTISHKVYTHNNISQCIFHTSRNKNKNLGLLWNWQVWIRDMLTLQAASTKWLCMWPGFWETLMWCFLMPSVSWTPCAARHPWLQQGSLITGCWQTHNQSPATFEVCQTHRGICAPLNPSALQATDASCFSWSGMDGIERREKEKTEQLKTMFSTLLLTHFLLACVLLANSCLNFSLLFIFPVIN